MTLASASSTSLPRYMTATRSETWRMARRSCEMKRYVRSRSRWSRSIRFMICAWMDTSRAEMGSSATTKSGSAASARAMAAGDLVGVALEEAGAQPHRLHHLAHAPLALGAAPAEAEGVERLADD